MSEVPLYSLDSGEGQQATCPALEHTVPSSLSLLSLSLSLSLPLSLSLSLSLSLAHTHTHTQTHTNTISLMHTTCTRWGTVVIPATQHKATRVYNKLVAKQLECKATPMGREHAHDGGSSSLLDLCDDRRYILDCPIWPESGLGCLVWAIIWP